MTSQKKFFYFYFYFLFFFNCTHALVSCMRGTISHFNRMPIPIFAQEQLICLSYACRACLHIETFTVPVRAIVYGLSRALICIYIRAHIPYVQNTLMCIASLILFHRTVAHTEYYAVCTASQSTVQIVLIHSVVLLFAELHERPPVVSSRGIAGSDSNNQTTLGNQPTPPPPSGNCGF